MGIESELGMELSMYKSMKSRVFVELKNPKRQTFIAQVKGFIFIVDQEDQVEFERLEDTIFPTDTELDKAMIFVTTIENIYKVERIKV